MVGITWWDLCERGAWLKGGGLLHQDLRPKKVYTALKKLIHEEWKTRAKGKTDAKGTFAFRGYHGAYRVTAKTNGKTIEADCHVRQGAENVLTMKQK